MWVSCPQACIEPALSEDESILLEMLKTMHTLVTAGGVDDTLLADMKARWPSKGAVRRDADTEAVAELRRLMHKRPRDAEGAEHGPTPRLRRLRRAADS